MARQRKRARTGAERQAAYAARKRALSPLERALGLPASEIYDKGELARLERIRAAQNELERECRMLREFIALRLSVEALSPRPDPERQRLNKAISALLDRHTCLKLPVH